MKRAGKFRARDGFGRAGPAHRSFASRARGMVLQALGGQPFAFGPALSGAKTNKAQGDCGTRPNIRPCATRPLPIPSQSAAEHIGRNRRKLRCEASLKPPAQLGLARQFGNAGYHRSLLGSHSIAAISSRQRIVGAISNGTQTKAENIRPLHAPNITRFGRQGGGQEDGARMVAPSNPGAAWQKRTPTIIPDERAQLRFTPLMGVSTVRFVRVHTSTNRTCWGRQRHATRAMREFAAYVIILWRTLDFEKIGTPDTIRRPTDHPHGANHGHLSDQRQDRPLPKLVKGGSSKLQIMRGTGNLALRG